MPGERMYASFLITDDSRTGEVNRLCSEAGVPFHLILRGLGTVDSAALNYLGFGERKKCIALSVLPPESTAAFSAAAAERLSLHEPGHGILFYTPVSGATAFLASLAKKAPVSITHPTDMTKERETPMAGEYTHELIIAVVTKGCFPEVKEAANAAGARGGTLLHGLGTGSAEAEKFLGIHIQPEKDVVLIVVPREQRDAIMRAVASAAGITTQGKGILFSIPVSGAVGLS